MNMFQLTSPPDLGTYIEALIKGNRETDTANLRMLIEQGTANIIARECSFAIINDLENEIKQSGYKVTFIPCAGSTAFADIYLMKF